jgi:hypothetical protein
MALFIKPNYGISLDAHQWIKKMWYIYTMEFNSTIKKIEIMWFAGKWIELEIPCSVK